MSCEEADRQIMSIAVVCSKQLAGNKTNTALNLQCCTNMHTAQKNMTLCTNTASTHPCPQLYR